MHNMSILSVVPRTSLKNETAIFLAYSQQEAGHYDTLIPNDNSSESETVLQLDDIQQVLITYKTCAHAQLSVTLLPQAVSQTFQHI